MSKCLDIFSHPQPYPCPFTCLRNTWMFPNLVIYQIILTFLKIFIFFFPIQYLEEDYWGIVSDWLLFWRGDFRIHRLYYTINIFKTSWAVIQFVCPGPQHKLKNQNRIQVGPTPESNSILKCNLGPIKSNYTILFQQNF